VGNLLLQRLEFRVAGEELALGGELNGFRLIIVHIQSIFDPNMKTCSLSEARRSLGRLADAALQGHPTVISRGGKLLILRAYEPPDPGEFDALIDEGIESEHHPLANSVWEGIRQRGEELARQSSKE
jgi:hypothetical protein